MEPKTSGGVEASSTCSTIHSKRLVHIRYKDHILFWNSDPILYERLNIREAIGWLERETEEFICLTSDRSVKSLPYERRDKGLVISKSDILEIREVK
jgi:hypothetical protein